MSTIETTVDDPRTAGIVESTIRRSSQIATLPGVALQIIRLCENPETTLDELKAVVDPVLAMRLLKLINSAYYGMSGQVTSIQHAILLLGLQAVKNLAIAASLVKLVRGGQVSEHFDASDLWTHSIAVASGARILARDTFLISPDEAFLAGLIHDMGIVVELQSGGPHFAEVIQKVSESESTTFRAAEEEVFGASHEDFGMGLCKAWNFPRTLQLATGYHHRPWDLPADQRLMPSIVHLADVLAAREGVGYQRTVETDEFAPMILDSLELSELDMLRVARKLPNEIQESQELLVNHD